jgi:UDP-N-acetylglucosamine acyltransferase
LLARFLKRPPVEPVTGPIGSIRRDAKTVVSPMAIVDPHATVGKGCEIGPFCTVGPDVTIGPGCRLISHVVITGRTTIGPDNVFYPHCVIGSEPQDKKYNDEESEVVIGAGNDFREAVTIHRGTTGGGMITRIGDENWLMVNCHIGHDCTIGHRCILANNVMVAGHVVIGNNVVMSGGAASHHYVTIGDYAFVAGLARIHHDVPPFVKVSDNDKVRAINAEGMRRSGVSDEDQAEIEDAVRKLFFAREKPFATVLAEFDAMPELNERVRTLVAFLIRRNSGKHGRYLESLRPKKNAAEEMRHEGTKDTKQDTNKGTEGNGSGHG